jgi:phage baseplate assembly protein gpV
MLTPLTPIKGNPAQGGCVTVRNAAQLPFGSYSMVQNIRGKHPNFIKRPGQRKLHSTADGSNEVLSLYQFRKSRVDEKHFYAQMSDGDILEATNDPPTVTTGVFGSEVSDGSANQIPASWSNHADKLIMSNGVDQHQIYCGTGSYIEKFIKYVGTAAIPDIPQLGNDYSKEVRNIRSDVADISSLQAITAYDCIYIRVPVPIVGLTFDIVSPNSNASVAAVQYNNATSGWVSVTGFDDGTASGGATLAQDGSMTFNTNINRPKFQFDSCGYWYRVVFDATLSGTVTIKTVTFRSEFQDIANVWNGYAPYAIEAQVDLTDSGRWYKYGGAAIDVRELTGGKIVIASSDPLEGLYIDCGATPQPSTKNPTIKFWDGTQFTTVTSPYDGSEGLKHSGWVTWRIAGTTPQQHHFQASVYAYWYEITFDGVLDSYGYLAIQTMPYFDISELGKSQCSVAWKNRAIYSFDEYPSYIYISKAGYPLVLNGSDYGILRAGDGRNNKVVNMQNYKDFLMVWQEEKGVEGGCVTLFSGSTPTNISRTVLSTRIGTMNAESVAVVEGVETATADKATALEEKIATLVFFLSNKGVCVSNGYTISIISDDIQNYFDSTKAECIRRGYEDKMWLTYDSAFGILRVGLVSGSLATKANVFPVYDLKDKTWSFDELGQKFACFAEIEAGSGNISTLQVAGGQEDGTVYQSNYGLNDVAESIHSYIQIELNYNGEVLNLREFLIRFEAMEYGEVILEFLKNNIHQMYKTVSMLPEKPGEIIKRRRFGLNITDQNISVKISCGEFNTEMNLIEIGMLTSIWSGR